jgi:hypothetical protein
MDSTVLANVGVKPNVVRSGFDPDYIDDEQGVKVALE